jgi:hypothetical protein
MWLTAYKLGGVDIRIRQIQRKIISIRLRQISRIGILISGMATVILLLVSFYGLNIGNFVIRIDDAKTTGQGISLSANRDFLNPTNRLTAVALQRADNITYTDIPKDIEYRDDNNNDPKGNYFAYSFYIRNSGQVDVRYIAQITIDELNKGVDSAIRVMIVKDYGERKIYAKPQEIGDHIGEPEPDTIPFYNETIIYHEEVNNFLVDMVSRYTIVIWLEGNDPQCIDDILGGGIKMSMSFKVVN